MDNKFEVFPHDISFPGIPWHKKLTLWLVGSPLIDDQGNKWGYFHKGIMYITADPSNNAKDLINDIKRESMLSEQVIKHYGCNESVLKPDDGNELAPIYFAVKERVEAIDQLRRDNNATKDQILKLLPFKVGDDRVIASFSHKGKTGTIESVSITHGVKSWKDTNDLYIGVILRGRVKLKDGTIGRKRFTESMEVDYKL